MNSDWFIIIIIIILGNLHTPKFWSRDHTLYLGFIRERKAN